MAPCGFVRDASRGKLQRQLCVLERRSNQIEKSASINSEIRAPKKANQRLWAQGAIVPQHIATTTATRVRATSNYKRSNAIDAKEHSHEGSRRLCAGPANHAYRGSAVSRRLRQHGLGSVDFNLDSLQGSFHLKPPVEPYRWKHGRDDEHAVLGRNNEDWVHIYWFYSVGAAGFSGVLRCTPVYSLRNSVVQGLMALTLGRRARSGFRAYGFRLWGLVLSHLTMAFWGFKGEPVECRAPGVSPSLRNPRLLKIQIH